MVWVATVQFHVNVHPLVCFHKSEWTIIFSTLYFERYTQIIIEIKYLYFDILVYWEFTCTNKCRCDLVYDSRKKHQWVHRRWHVSVFLISGLSEGFNHYKGKWFVRFNHFNSKGQTVWTKDFEMVTVAYWCQISVQKHPICVKLDRFQWFLLGILFLVQYFVTMLFFANFKQSKHLSSL